MKIERFGRLSDFYTPRSPQKLRAEILRTNTANAVSLEDEQNAPEDKNEEDFPEEEEEDSKPRENSSGLDLVI